MYTEYFSQINRFSLSFSSVVIYLGVCIYILVHTFFARKHACHVVAILMKEVIGLSLSEELTSKLVHYQMVDIIPGSATFKVPFSCIMTWFVMAVIVILAIIFTRNMQIVPKGKQAIFEVFMGMLYNVFYGILGEKGKKFIPLLLTIILYLGISNILGFFGLVPPTKDLNVTAGLAGISIVVVIYAGISFRGFKGWLKHFAYPTAIITPLEVLQIVIKPLSLCMRLFGNVLGAYIVMEIIMFCVPAVVPIAASAYFDFFDGLLQAFIFCFLTAMYIAEAQEEEI